MATNTIDTVFGFGEDALSNLFEISLVTYPTAFESAEKPIEFMKGRITNFSVPGSKLETYDRHYKTQKVQVPNGKVATEKETTFKLRVDRDFVFYNILNEWVNRANSSKNLMAIGNMEDYLGTFVVKRVGNDLLPIDGSSGKNVGWQFNKAFIKSVGNIDLDYVSGEPITVDVTMSFGWMDVLSQTITNAK